MNPMAQVLTEEIRYQEHLIRDRTQEQVKVLGPSHSYVMALYSELVRINSSCR